MAWKTQPDGTKTYQGLHYTNSSNVISVRGYVSCGRKCWSRHGLKGMTAYDRSWVNKCPQCKKKGLLFCHGAGYIKQKPTKKFVPTYETQITCNHKAGGCDGDFCSVAGYSTEGRCKSRLYASDGGAGPEPVPGSEDSNNNTYEQTLEDLTKEFHKRRKPVLEWELDTPPLKDLYAGTYIEARRPLIPTTEEIGLNEITYFITESNYTAKSMTNRMAKEVPEPGTEYQAPNRNDNGGGGDVDPSGTETRQSMMRKGKELGTLSKIISYCKKNGGRGMTYAGYYSKGFNPNKWHEPEMRRIWYKPKSGNCVAFAWMFHTVCSGAGIKMKIRKGYTKSGIHHWFNEDCKGKIYDMSTSNTNARGNRGYVVNPC